ncbi:CxC2 domain-containing protein [Mycena indigotica]|uniref:CxC2 domain-containing protein n=1 Tax=Mycena indigotica TaxID=2126181 RepID=A0A8H6SLR8_9AGAR|nr:CxC2 domain-containing protein [Mycena indigotica]KAF7301155.1 CxC2 domain-containing protein [Mycena indigotica]
MAPLTRAQRHVYFDDNIDLEPQDEQITLSVDGRRGTLAGLNLSPRKRPRTHKVEEADPQLQGWMPFPEDDAEELDAIASTISSFDVILDEELTKRKRYNSDDPMLMWKRIAPVFLEELARHDGLGGRAHCKLCLAPITETDHRVVSKKSMLGVPSIRCKNGPDSSGPEVSLYHRKTSGEGVNGLGELHQLGHDGDVCPFPGARRAMVVIDMNGIYNVDVQYCDCNNTNGTDTVEQLLRNCWYPATVVSPATCATFAVLEHFRLLRALGNVTTHDFICALERQQDPTQTEDTPDRYKAFGRMARQYDFLKRMKRAGRAHEPGGMVSTKPGGLAVLCWACPDEGRNLPEGWQNVKEQNKYLYKLMLSIDANFRLKNRLRANERDDPSLGPGLGYFVESTAYKEHLKNYVAEKDASSVLVNDNYTNQVQVSSCVAFAALLQKETRLTTGLRVSGVAGCKGERYANVDWIVACTLWMEKLLSYGFAYDIICQWMVNFFQRIEKIRKGNADTSNLATEFENVDIQFGLPVWHAGAHELQCRAQLALAYLLGIGKTDGEAMERVWASLNPASWATKEMGEGARLDVLEDRIDQLNFEKNIHLGKCPIYEISNFALTMFAQERHLLGRLIVAISERRVQGIEFAEFDKSISSKKRKEWKSRMDAWYKDPTSNASPFVIVGGQEDGPSERQIVDELKKAEVEEARAGHAPLLEGTKTVVAFIKAGLQLQHIQRKIQATLKSKTLTADRASQVQELRVSFLKQLRSFQHLQLTYMPGIETLREADDAKRDVNEPESRSITPLALSKQKPEFGVGNQPRSGFMEQMGQERHAASRTPAELRTGFLGFGMGPTKAARFMIQFGSSGLKARARKQRWEEEVELLREEMKRVLRSLRWTQNQWQVRADRQRDDVNMHVAAGLRAYALRQVDIHRRMAERFYSEWGRSLANAVRAVVKEDEGVLDGAFDGLTDNDMQIL